MPKIRFSSLVIIMVMALSLVGNSSTIRVSAQTEPKSTWTVNSAGDEPDANLNDYTCATATGTCTLRAAIQTANDQDNVGSHTINFSANFEIAPLSNLPTISDDNMIITAIGHTVSITKPPSGSATNGLSIGAAGCRIHNLIVTGFTTGILVNGSDNFIGVRGDGTNDDKEGNQVINNTSYGINVNSGLRNQISGNLIGLDSDGHTQPNGTGIRVASADTIIGTNGDGVGDQWEFNIISANTGFGISVVSGGGGTKIAGNLIGLKSGGMEAAGNGLDGIDVGVANNVRIGTNGDNLSDSYESNFISGNTNQGIRIDSGYGHKISGNKIGLGANGSTVFANGQAGIQIAAAAYDLTIGVDEADLSYSAAERNIISGNQNNGIHLQGYQVRVAGNYIGTDQGGTLDRGNVQSGIYIEGQANTIGTDGDGVGDSYEANIISGNNMFGVVITGTGANNNILAGNIIGLNASGSAAIGNTLSGISLQNGPSGTHIGVGGTSTSDSYERNTISGNGNSGIVVTSAGSTTICGNAIGLDKTDLVDLGNTGYGILIEAGNNTAITIGVPDGGRATLGNVIAGNGLYGIRINDSDNHIIAGNRIGLNGGGDIAIPNDGFGVYIDNSANIRIGTNGDGTTDSLEGNVISGNAFSGIELFGSATLNTVIAGNKIGTWNNGYVPMPNGQYGIHLINNPSGTRIGTNGDGTSDTYERNLISGNTLSGIRLESALNTTISGNYIGTDLEGSYAISNGNHGILIDSDVVGIVTVGVPNGGVAAQGNLVSGNSWSGIWINGSDAHIIAGNVIGMNVDRDTSIPNGQYGISLQDSSANTIGTNSDGNTDSLERNLIGGNSQAGIYISGGTSLQNRISQNSFMDNGGLAIDLAPAGVTPNDGLDSDAGPNTLLNHPVIRTAIFPAGNQVYLAGDFHSTPSSYFMIQFYVSTDMDPSGFGEGEVFLQEINVVTDAGGTAYFGEFIPLNLGPLYRYFSAIAISENYNTSEFGPAVEEYSLKVFLPVIQR